MSDVVAHIVRTPTFLLVLCIIIIIINYYLTHNNPTNNSAASCAEVQRADEALRVAIGKSRYNI